MKLVDIFFLLLLGLGAFLGYKKGFLVEIISFFALIIAILASIKLLSAGIDLIKPFLKDLGTTIPIVAFLLIFILVFVGIILLGKLLKRILDYTPLGTFDNLAGAALGIIKFAFGISLIIWVLNAANLSITRSLSNGSAIYPYLINFAPKTVHWISIVIPFQDVFQNLSQYFN